MAVSGAVQVRARVGAQERPARLVTDVTPIASILNSARSRTQQHEGALPAATACLEIVPIAIRWLKGGRYSAQVSPPHGREPWSTAGMVQGHLVQALLQWGCCHQTDLGDAFEGADPGWAVRQGGSGPA